jgi:DNA segregation ATPase FtsK/SpoIIIE, S-DNA-T family
MAAKKPKSNGAPPAPTFQPRNARPRIFLGLVTLVLALLTFLAAFDHQPPMDTAVDAQNLVGVFGSTFAHYAMHYIGWATWLIPAAALWLSYLFFAARSHLLRFDKWACLPLLIVSGCVLLAVAHKAGFSSVPHDGNNLYPYGLGGHTGRLLYDRFLFDFLGSVGTGVVFGVIVTFSLGVLLADNLLVDGYRLVTDKGKAWAIARLEKRRERLELAALDKAKKEEAARKAAAAAAKAAAQAQPKPGNAAPAPVVATGAPIPPTKPSLGRPTVEPLPLMTGAKPFQPLIDGAPDGEPPASATGKPTPLAIEKPRIVKPILKVAKEEAAALASDDQQMEDMPPPVIKPKPGAKAGAAGEPESGPRIIATEQPRKASVPLPHKRGNYVFPPISLLSESPAEIQEETTEDYYHTAEQVVRTLEEFGVKVTMGEIHVGPVITRYDVHPAPGVRVEKIVNLDKNLALGLKAMSVRILAPVPGKGCVGIEVPNRKPRSVYIKDILESESWVNTKAEIPIALGKEVSGQPLVADLTRMPHLLIAGSTGSGKTVCINTIITSLLYHASPEDVRFVMVDPKIVEMQVFNSLPHMLVPVVTDPKKVPNALKYLLNEMERRYHMFAAIGVRNIAGYNAKMAKNRVDAAAAELRAAEMDACMTPEERAATASISVPRDPDVMEVAPEKLPYIVCIVDELADLMMVAPADIETGIARLAQLARAAGIHLILATQRPSVNVITGVIKANLPSRIAFKVASKVDSRTILDVGGADQLIGKGDMLFLPPGSADLVRSQGAFTGDEEIAGIVEFIRANNGEPVFDEQFQRNIEITDEDEAAGSGEEETWDDNMVPQAIEVIRTTKRASTSMLQRRLKIGYNRAARIMDLLEEQGMVGPDNGSSPREILMDID